jgi:prepilin-type N-terminal cleavage/methylation domain-containing protein
MTRRRPPTRPQRCRRRAFSLLELILALSMVAMLAGSMYVALTAAVKAKETAASAVAPIGTAVLAADLMRQDLESVLPPGGLLSGQFVGTSNSGSDTLLFRTIGNDGALVQHPLSEGARQIELGIRSDVQPPVLVRRVTRNLLPTTEAMVEEEILCRDVRTFTVRYFDGTIWQDSWDSTVMGDVLPAAVEMTLEMNLPPRAGQTAPRPYRVTRIIPLVCAKAPADDAAALPEVPQ